MGTGEAAKAATAVTHESIVREAEMLLRRYGARRLTLTDVGRALGVSHAALYRYFDGKAALQEAIVGQWIDESVLRIEQACSDETDPAALIHRVLHEMHAAKKAKIRSDPEVYQLYLAVLEAMPPKLQSYVQLVRGVLASALSRYMGKQMDRDAALEDLQPDVREALTVLENATFRFLHPVHTMEALDEDTETQLRWVVDAILRAYDPTRE